MATIADGAAMGLSHDRRTDGFAGLIGTGDRERPVQKRQDILRPGEATPFGHLLIAGYACRYRVLGNGRRQITALLVPGDICDLHAALKGWADYAVSALTPCTVSEFPVAQFANGSGVSPEWAASLLRVACRDEAIAREWIVSLGRRNAVERLSHLFCELRVRLGAVGLATEDAYAVTFGQTEFADALGLSTVHVNRALQELRKAGLIRLAGGMLTILDRPALERLAQFDPAYLHG